MTFVLGLTGSIATGKSTVSNYFSELGFPVIDADIIARQVVEPGTVGLEKITKTFGREFLTSQGVLDRAKLASLVFSDDAQRHKLNAILKREIRQTILHLIDEYRKNEHVRLVVVDIPLLYEGGYQADMDEIMVVYIDEELEIERLMARNQLTIEQAKERINSQLSIEKKRALADSVIDNRGSIAASRAQVKEWLLNQKLYPEGH